MGRHGSLPELASDNKDSGIATSIMQSTLRRRSRALSPVPPKLEFKADVEPLIQDQQCPIPMMLDSPQTMERELASSPVLGRKVSDDHSSLGQSLSRRTSRPQSIQEEPPSESFFSFTKEDEVVSEDGKLRGGTIS